MPMRAATEGCKAQQLPLLNLDQPEDAWAWNTRASSPSVRPVTGLIPDSLLDAEQMAALTRFAETCDDDEDFDVPLEMM